MTGDPKKSDELLLFGRIARKHRFVLSDDLRECLAIQDKLRMMGGRRPLGEVLIDQGYLTLDHVEWILTRQGGCPPLPPDRTLFGDLATVNGFIARGAVQRALKKQRKGTKKEDPRRVGEILVSEGEMAASERDAILFLQQRLRGSERSVTDPETPRAYLVLEAGPKPRHRWRPMFVAMMTGALLALIAALLAYAILV